MYGYRRYPVSKTKVTFNYCEIPIIVYHRSWTIIPGSGSTVCFSGREIWKSNLMAVLSNHTDGRMRTRKTGTQAA